MIVKKFPALFTTRSYDEHWKPASLYCSVCAKLDYTNILHFENIQSEERFFVETLNASNVVQPRYKISFTLEQYLLYIIILYAWNSMTLWLKCYKNIFIFNRWENKNSKEKASKEEVLGSYFNLLTDEEIKSLYKIYEDDFLNFGYKFAYRTLKLG